MERWEKLFEEKIRETDGVDDPAHDLLHFKRVVATAKGLGKKERANEKILVPAAWLHDLVIVPKNDPRRSEASKLSALAARKFLKSIGYPEKYHDDIAHAVEAHSFSANIPCKTLESRIVQDADRLDGLGAMGIARCFATAGLMRRAFYSEIDPFCGDRPPDDAKFTVDHFYAKLFKTVETLQTKAGKAEGRRRLKTMKTYLQNLKSEIYPKSV